MSAATAICDLIARLSARLSAACSEAQAESADFAEAIAILVSWRRRHAWLEYQRVGNRTRVGWQTLTLGVHPETKSEKDIREPSCAKRASGPVACESPVRQQRYSASTNTSKQEVTDYRGSYSQSSRECVTEAAICENLPVSGDSADLRNDHETRRTRTGHNGGFIIETQTFPPRFYSCVACCIRCVGYSYELAIVLMV